jgi:hypothetical protein
MEGLTINYLDLIQYNFYEYENLLSDSEQKFKDFVMKKIHKGEYEEVIRILKASGICIDIFKTGKYEKLYNEIEQELRKKVGNWLTLEKLKIERKIFEEFFTFFNEIREKYLENEEIIPDNIKVASYLLALEIFLSQCYDFGRGYSEKEINNKYPYILNFKDILGLRPYDYYAEAFELACESSGMILKYFMHKKVPFKGLKKNVSYQRVQASTSHINLSQLWTRLYDILEYWKYSDVKIEYSEKEGIYTFEIMDEQLELNNLISNDRFNNLRKGWFFQNHFDKPIDDFPFQISSADPKKSQLYLLFTSLYLGITDFSKKIFGVEIGDWLKAYDALVYESQIFLKKRNKKGLKNLNLNHICLAKTKNDWIKFFNRKGIDECSAEIIIDKLTFNRKSEDLIDCPFVSIDDQLVILPTLVANVDVTRALSSNFLNQNANLNFKGKFFEERILALLKSKGITASQLYTKHKGEEYECDVAFVINNHLFFVECKAHVQPFTTRQHCNHLRKLYSDVQQFKRIWNFYKKNIDIVKKELKLKENFKPRTINKILITTSMVGMPLQIEGCYVIDESAFTTLIDRTPPRALSFFDGKGIEIYSENFDVFEGPLTYQKIISFLNNPPQIQIMKKMYSKEHLDLSRLNVRFIYHQKSIPDLNIGYPLSNDEIKILKEEFGFDDYLIKNLDPKKQLS